MNGDDASDRGLAREEFVELTSSPPSPVPAVLHRLAEVRKAQGVTRRVLAQRLGITVEELRAKEDSAEVSLLTLREWASKLKVPVTELVVEQDECLTPTRLARSQATRLLKLAATLRDRSRNRGIQRLAQTFVDQLAEIVPSLGKLGEKNFRRRNRQQTDSALPPLPERVFTRRVPRP